MKIALLMNQWRTYAGGVERAARYLVEALLEQGHELHIFATHFDQLPEPVFAHPIRTTRHSLGGRDFSFAKNVDRALKKHHFDLVHSFTRTLNHDVIRLGGGTHREYINRMKTERSPIANLFGILNPKSRAMYRVEREGFARGHYRKIVAVSRQVKNEVMQHYDVPEEDIVVIHNAVDLKRFNPYKREECREALNLPGRRVLLYCGAGFKRKGLRYAIEATARVNDAVLLVTGGGKTAPYEALARRVGADVRFLGERRDIEKLYPAVDLLLHPTLYDPFPNVCLEAMACGTAVVTTKVAGVSEIISHGGNSYVVEHGSDVDAIVEAVERWNPAVGEAAARRASRQTIQKNVNQNLEVYRSLQGRFAT